MNRMSIPLTIFAAMLLSATAQADTKAQASTTLTVVEHAATDAVTDTGATGDTAGDLLTFANPVFDAANKHQIGTDQGYCVRTEVGKSWECFWTLTLADGQLTVEGPFFDKGDSVLAITGGTGKYAAARGQMKLHARDEKGSEYDFVYALR
jgi:hypothetical protein